MIEFDKIPDSSVLARVLVRVRFGFGYDLGYGLGSSWVPGFSVGSFVKDPQRTQAPRKYQGP